VFHIFVPVVSVVYKVSLHKRTHLHFAEKLKTIFKLARLAKEAEVLKNTNTQKAEYVS